MNLSKHKSIVGRKAEIQKLRNILKLDEPIVITVHGRRRVGKTFLLEYVTKAEKIWKFEGLEKQPKSKQIEHVLEVLAEFLNDFSVAKLKFKKWKEVFELIAKHAPKNLVLYFEEVQWLANYRTDFVSELKYVWDNKFRKLAGIKIILCGSSASFIVKKIVKSNALYNRSAEHLSVKPFDLKETYDFFNKRLSVLQTLEAYLLVGGIPEYLKYLKKYSSPYLGICKESFVNDGFIYLEYEKVFTSNLAKHPDYKNIIEFLALNGASTKDQIIKYLKSSGGGSLSAVLEDLMQCGFIVKIKSFDSYKDNSHNVRYDIADYFLRFWSQFIKPLKNRIQKNAFAGSELSVIDKNIYKSYLGLQFERFCRENSEMIAKKLGFHNIAFQDGGFYRRKDFLHSGLQIDLGYLRSDNILTICEVKFQDKPIGVSVINEFQKKEDILKMLFGSYSIERVLISASGGSKDLIKSKYFDRIIEPKDFSN